LVNFLFIAKKNILNFNEFITYNIILLTLNRSAGATVVEMLTTQPPWSKLTIYEVVYRIGQREKPEYVLDSSLGAAVRNFLDEIFNYDSERRPSAEELLVHHWFLFSKCFKG